MDTPALGAAFEATQWQLVYTRWRAAAERSAVRTGAGRLQVTQVGPATANRKQEMSRCLTELRFGTPPPFAK